jgi:uncharacterized protein YbjT (DUF2867 family)
MKHQAIIFGATGMVGQSVLHACLESKDITSVLVVTRQSCQMTHPKLKEIIHADLYDLSDIEKELTGYSACFFCVGMSASQLKEQEYHQVTYSLTISVAEVLLKVTSDFSFCYISAQGADSSEKGNIMWARVKGKTENKLLSMPFKDAYMFRPGFIQPMRGIKSKTRLYNIIYAVLSPFYVILKNFKGSFTNTDILGRAFVHAVVYGYSKKHVEIRDINTLGER